MICNVGRKGDLFMYVGGISAGYFYGVNASYGRTVYVVPARTGARSGPVPPVSPVPAVNMGRSGNGVEGSPAVIYTPSGIKMADGAAQIPGQEEVQNDEKKVQSKSSPAECQTCKERKYKDGSNENVSFKAAAHISPGAAGAVVRAHEGEHVSNAYTKAAQKNGKVISASVSIHTSTCPECGRTYVSGGTTRTAIKYSNEKNPYQRNQKSQDALRLRGRNIDYAA